MPTADSPLLHAIIASYHEPTPARAFRYRPFVYGSSRRLDGTARPRLRLRVPVVAHIALGAVRRRFTPIPQPNAAACCAPACC